MESQSSRDDGDGRRPWRSETNWTIADGSLGVSVAVESSDSPIDVETDDCTVKSPLVLKPPSPDCGPCEISISFTQKHEVRQIYVRSSARVYEIYYAPAPLSSKEYLCTVRCGIATRDDEFFRAADIEEPIHAYMKDSADVLLKKNSKDDGNVGANEDGWVEVKVPDSPPEADRKSPLPEKIVPDRGASFQDFFEATAEISDADPCTSLTLRLLSLQSKECVYVDEVYVFAEPVESTNSENQAIAMGNPVGSSLMTMLVPTLLQLSKTGVSRIQDQNVSDKMEKQGHLNIGSRTTDATNIVNKSPQEGKSGLVAQQDVRSEDMNVFNQLQDKNTSNKMEKQEQQDIGFRTTNATNIANEIQQEEKSSLVDQQDVKVQDMNSATTEPPPMQIPIQVLGREKRHDFAAKGDMPFSHFERALEQLISRVSRIEDVCLRFEENMLKPMSNMEARLQHVEQQLETLINNSQNSVLSSGTRISAPEFSCTESNSSSYYDGSDHPTCGALDLKKRDFPSAMLSNPPDDLSISVNPTNFLPSLVVSAPEFSCGDDEEDNSPQDKPKQGLSIDDALAAALTGFLSTSSVQPSKYTKALSVKAPEFPVEENSDGKSSPRFQNENMIDSVSTSTSVSSVYGVQQVMTSLSHDYFVETSEGCPLAQAKHDLEKADDCQIVEKTKRGEDNCGISNVSVSQEKDVLKDFLGNQTENISDTPQEGVTRSTVDIAEGSENSNGISNISFSEEKYMLKQISGNQIENSSNSLQDDVAGGTEDIAEGSSKDLFLNVPKSSLLVDFGLPILDLRFASCGNSSSEFPLETLLAGMPDFFGFQTPCVQESDDGFVEQSNLISVEDGEPMKPTTDSHPLWDMDSYDARDAPSTTELLHPCACSTGDTFDSLI